MADRQKLIDMLLDFDALAHAENVTGKRLGQGSDADNALAIALLSERSQSLRSLLQESNDTWFAMPWEDFVALVESNEACPFEPVFSEEWEDHSFLAPGAAPRRRQGKVWANRDNALLLVGNNFSSSVNSTDLYFQIDCDGCPSLGFSGGFCFHPNGERTLVGHIDAREALFHQLFRLLLHGTPRKPWIIHDNLHPFVTSPFPPAVKNESGSDFQRLYGDEFQRVFADADDELRQIFQILELGEQG